MLCLKGWLDKFQSQLQTVASVCLVEHENQVSSLSSSLARSVKRRGLFLDTACDWSAAKSKFNLTTSGFPGPLFYVSQRIKF